MKTKITNYINAEDFEVIINSDFPHKKANIIAKSLYDVFIVVSVGDKFTSYILQENLTYINTNPTVILPSKSRNESSQMNESVSKPNGGAQGPREITYRGMQPRSDRTKLLLAYLAYAADEIREESLICGHLVDMAILELHSLKRQRRISAYPE